MDGIVTMGNWISCEKTAIGVEKDWGNTINSSVLSEKTGDMRSVSIAGGKKSSSARRRSEFWRQKLSGKRKEPFSPVQRGILRVLDDFCR